MEYQIPFNYGTNNAADIQEYRKRDKFTVQIMSKALNQENSKRYLSSCYSMPSICPTFMSFLTNLLLGKNNTAENIDASKRNLYQLIFTPALGSFRVIDSILTYTSAIAHMTKYLSLYDVSEEREIPYASAPQNEPYLGAVNKIEEF